MVMIILCGLIHTVNPFKINLSCCYMKTLICAALTYMNKVNEKQFTINMATHKGG